MNHMKIKFVIYKTSKIIFLLKKFPKINFIRLVAAFLHHFEPQIFLHDHH